MCMWFLVVKGTTLPSPHLPFKHCMLSFLVETGLLCRWKKTFSMCPQTSRTFERTAVFLSAAVSGPQSPADKEGLRSHFKSLSHYFIVTLCDKEYQCTYVTVISFLAFNFWLCFSSWRTLNETWAPLLVHIYFALRVCLNCVNTNFD